MDRIEAVKVLNRIPVNYIGMTIDEANRADEALSMAARALRPVSREQVERMRATLEPTTLPDGTKTVATKCSECGAHNLITHLFCWRCGSPLTDEAVNLLANRLEEVLRDGN